MAHEDVKSQDKRKMERERRANYSREWWKKGSLSNKLKTTVNLKHMSHVRTHPGEWHPLRSWAQWIFNSPLRYSIFLPVRFWQQSDRIPFTRIEMSKKDTRVFKRTHTQIGETLNVINKTKRIARITETQHAKGETFCLLWHIHTNDFALKMQQKANRITSLRISFNDIEMNLYVLHMLQNAMTFGRPQCERFEKKGKRRERNKMLQPNVNKDSKQETESCKKDSRDECI